MGAAVKIGVIGAIVLIAGGAASGAHGHAHLSANEAAGRRLAASRGWTGAQWTCLDELWIRESGWDQYAQNPDSTAYGIPQFLDSTWGLDGTGPKTSDPVAQISDGLDFIAARYGTPCGAWAHEESAGWY